MLGEAKVTNTHVLTALDRDLRVFNHHLHRFSSGVLRIEEQCLADQLQGAIVVLRLTQFHRTLEQTLHLKVTFTLGSECANLRVLGILFFLHFGATGGLDGGFGSDGTVKLVRIGAKFGVRVGAQHALLAIDGDLGLLNRFLSAGVVATGAEGFCLGHQFLILGDGGLTLDLDVADGGTDRADRGGDAGVDFGLRCDEQSLGLGVGRINRQRITVMLGGDAVSARGLGLLAFDDLFINEQLASEHKRIVGRGRGGHLSSDRSGSNGILRSHWSYRWCQRCCRRIGFSNNWRYAQFGPAFADGGHQTIEATVIKEAQVQTAGLDTLKPGLGSIKISTGLAKISGDLVDRLTGSGEFDVAKAGDFRSARGDISLVFG